MGVLSDFQAVETVLDSENLTLGFNATTQGSLHVNNIHTSNIHCHVIAADQWPGGTAEDYELHINDS